LSFEPNVTQMSRFRKLLFSTTAAGRANKIDPLIRHREKETAGMGSSSEQQVVYSSPVSAIQPGLSSRVFGVRACGG
jgi:hypothetical protein